MKLTTIHSDYPLVVFREAASTIVGRFGLFALTYAAAFIAVGLVAVVVDLLGGDGRPWSLRPRSFVGLLEILWTFPAIGLFGLWGIPSYSALVLLAVSFIVLDEPASRVLPVVLLLQIFEILRSTCQLEGWETLLEAEFIAVAVLWAAGVFAYVLYRMRRRRSVPGA